MITSKHTYHKKYFEESKKNCEAMWANIQEII